MLKIFDKKIIAFCTLISGTLLLGGCNKTDFKIKKEKNSQVKVEMKSLAKLLKTVSKGAKKTNSTTKKPSYQPKELKRTKHTENRHVDRAKYPDKSKYTKPNQKEKLENRTIKKPDKVEKQSGDRKIYEKDYGRKIGTKGETKHKVVVDEKKKKIVTSYPKKDK